MTSLFDTQERPQLLLAPMAGVNDPVFRAICRQMGAHLTYTEMISVKGLAYKNTRTEEMVAALPGDLPYAVQLFGDDPQLMANEAARLAEKLGQDLALIDINMGCPARKVLAGGGGAALLQKPQLAAAIVEAVSAAVQVPVTVKMRLVKQGVIPCVLVGEQKSIYFTEIDDAPTLGFAKLMAASGAAALAIHGRLPEQFYSGVARQDIVGLLARYLDIPVIASGDVFAESDIAAYGELGASAIMVARGARGNPWIFAGRNPSLEERIAIAREHTVRLHEWEPRKLVWMRKHLAWYFRGTAYAVKVRKAVQTAVELDDYLQILGEIEN